MKQIILIIFLSTTVFLSTSSNVLIAGELHLVTLQYPPLVFQDDTGEIQGVAVEIVESIMNELGHTVSIKMMPWTRALKMVQFGKADAIFTIFKNPHRETFLDFSDEVLIHQPVSFYKRKDRTISYTGDLKELKPFKIGVVSTISYGNHFDKTRPMLNTESTASLEQNFSKMLLGRIDLVISNSFSANTVIQHMNISDKIIKISPSVENVPSYISYSKLKNLTNLKREFDSKLVEFKQNGKYYRILEKSGLIIKE